MDTEEDDDKKKEEQSGIEMQDRDIDAPPNDFDPLALVSDAEESAAAKRRKFRKVTSLIHYDLKLAARGEVLRQSTIVEKGEDDDVPLENVSLFCFGPQNKFRILMHTIDGNKVYKAIILTLIVISTVTLALETPLDNPEGEKIRILTYIDYFMTAAFTIEAIIKIISRGFLFAGKGSYFREAWNIIDFTIVVAALLGIIAGDAI